MFKLFLVLFLFHRFGVSAERNDDLPNLFEIDNYYECKEGGKIFCTVKIDLKPENESSEIWNRIERYSRSTNYFDRRSLYHGICVNHKTKPEIETEIRNKYKNRYLNLGLSSDVNDMYCYTNQYYFRLRDALPIILVLILSLITIYATYSDWNQANANSYVMAFSVVQNWRNIKNTNKKYSFLEGLRTYTMIIIVGFHTFATYLSVYIKNPEYAEQLTENNAVLIRLSMYVVQIYLVISAVLNIIRVRDIYENKGELSARDLIIVIINRWARIWPVLIVLLAFHTSNIPVIVSDGPLNFYVEREMNYCQKNWFLSLTLLHNIINGTEMCMSIAWYLAVDTQLYMISLLIAYIAFKLKISLTKVFGFILIGSISFNAILNYIKGFPPAFPIGPQMICMGKHIENPIYTSMYMSTYSNLASYTVGILCGNIFYDRKQTGKKSQVFSIISLLAFVILPVLSIKLSLIVNDYPKLVQAMFSGFGKALYCSGVAFGIYGFLMNYNVWFKKIFEWKPLVILGNFTYSTYLFHIGPVMVKVTHIKEPIYLDDFIFVTNFIRDLFISYVTGIIVWFVLEAPFQQLQKMILPQVIKAEKIKDK